jgi:hypothetical protein
MISQLYQREIKEIGQGIIKESEKENPDVIALKAKMDDLVLVIEMIKRESKLKMMSTRLSLN